MYQPPRGTRDFLPDEMLKRNWVFDRVREIYEIYGYEPLGTPAFESWELLKVKSGEDIVNQIYYFRDKSDRELGLRFEWTASLARVVAAHRELQMPFKRYAIGPVWRYENPSEKRFREFWQADADIVGVADYIADAEVIATAVECLGKLGFEGFVIRINDRRILEGFIKTTGLPEDKIPYIIRAIDKLGKIGREGVLAELLTLVKEQERCLRLLDVISSEKVNEDILRYAAINLEKSDEGQKGCIALQEIRDYSKLFGFNEFLEVDFTLARGLDYYTGPIYEISAQGYEEYGSIAGGGRYDEIIGLFGGDPTPATGISLGLERIVPLLEFKGVFNNMKLGTNILVASVSKNTRGEAIKMAQELRKSGLSTIIDLYDRRLSKQLEYADKKGVKKVVILGEKELREGNVTVRNMSTGEQVKIDRGTLVNFLRK